MNIYPSPSQLNFSLTSVRLDKTGQFIAPKGLLQFSVIATATEPIEWHFTGVDGPSLTPSIQNDRLISNFYDPSTYCHISKLLINLRHKNSSQDTGCFIARIGSAEKNLKFCLFVPNDERYFISNDTEINVNLCEDLKLPCGVSDPNIEVTLVRDNYTDINSTYDPIHGFTISNDLNNLGKWKCLAGKEELVVNVVQKSKLRNYVYFLKIIW